MDKTGLVAPPLHPREEELIDFATKHSSLDLFSPTTTSSPTSALEMAMR
jgi:hypothetical protein